MHVQFNHQVQRHLGLVVFSGAVHMTTMYEHKSHSWAVSTAFVEERADINYIAHKTVRERFWNWIIDFTSIIWGHWTMKHTFPQQSGLTRFFFIFQIIQNIPVLTFFLPQKLLLTCPFYMTLAFCGIIFTKRVLTVRRRSPFLIHFNDTPSIHSVCRKGLSGLYVISHVATRGLPFP